MSIICSESGVTLEGRVLEYEDVGCILNCCKGEIKYQLIFYN